MQLLLLSSSFSLAPLPLDHVLTVSNLVPDSRNDRPDIIHVDVQYVGTLILREAMFQQRA